MSEGGQYPWKRQTIKSVPTADYSNLRDPLPLPPIDMEWDYLPDERTWRLIKKGTKKDGTTTASNNNNNNVKNQQQEKDCKIHDSSNNNNNNYTELDACRTHPHQNQSSSSSKSKSITKTGQALVKEGVLNVDYLVHVVLPSDTLQGICLAYRLTPYRLRQVNQFSGHTLLLAPAKLIIPLTPGQQPPIRRPQDTDAPQFKLHSFLAEHPDLRRTEAKAYLELANWDLKEAVRAARADKDWEDDQQAAEVDNDINNNKASAMVIHNERDALRRPLLESYDKLEHKKHDSFFDATDGGLAVNDTKTPHAVKSCYTTPVVAQEMVSLHSLI